MRYALKVNGMHCKACAMLVQEALEDAGAKNIAIRVDEKKQQGAVSFESAKPKHELVKIIEEQGDYIVEN